MCIELQRKHIYGLLNIEYTRSTLENLPVSLRLLSLVNTEQACWVCTHGNGLANYDPAKTKKNGEKKGNERICDGGERGKNNEAKTKQNQA